ncbi:MAG: Asp-tRNA(Asn)/Glu-tRNA(Gln) amidotransferase subunit GatC [Rickettsiales bacterium]|nr:Asp-tRNA(Asn)/Glu-tRNA(Gln) amidotransferase subunit GatC [Rickettsiales bacterium]
MAKVTENDIKKIAHLARIEVSEKSRQDLANQVGSIINWVEKLNEVNSENITELSSVHQITLPTTEDKVSANYNAEEILQNSKDAKYGYFTVPKVIE